LSLGEESGSRRSPGDQERTSVYNAILRLQDAGLIECVGQLVPLRHGRPGQCYRLIETGKEVADRERERVMALYGLAADPVPI
jgi:DNA-binding PadR family transcriptional regulator